MRLLTLLATTILLAACLHDQEDQQLFVAERGASLTYMLEAPANSEADDPWDTIQESFGIDAVYKDGGTHDDPWDSIRENFAVESVHTGKSHDDPWDEITVNFGVDCTHTSKRTSQEVDSWNELADSYGDNPPGVLGLTIVPERTDERRFMGWEKSTAVFVSFDLKTPTTDRARVAEVRGNVLRLEFADGVEQFVVNAPASWAAGIQLETGFLGATSKKDMPFLGVRFWRTVGPARWGSVELVDEVAAEGWPQGDYLRGASLLASIASVRKDHVYPWDTIQNNFGVDVKSGGGAHDDPWDSIRQNFDVESTHTGKSYDDPRDTIIDSFGPETVHTGKSHDDPWETINEKFGPDSVHTGKKTGWFQEVPTSTVLFVSVRGVGKDKGDPWDAIGESFPVEKSGTVALRLTEIRGDVGRFITKTGVVVFGVGIPAEWTPGVILRGEAFLLKGDENLPLKGAMVWSLDRNLSETPKSR